MCSDECTQLGDQKRKVQLARSWRLCHILLSILQTGTTTARLHIEGTRNTAHKYLVFKAMLGTKKVPTRYALLQPDYLLGPWAQMRNQERVSVGMVRIGMARQCATIRDIGSTI